MKPIPAPPGSTEPEPSASPKPTLGNLTPAPGAWSGANRRNSTSTVQRAYPWLLALSTLVAAVFCVMYITKPVIVSGEDQAEEEQSPVASTTTGKSDSKEKPLLPNLDALPGQTAGSHSNADQAETPSQTTTASTRSNFEETNLRVQHILTAEAPGGHINRIDIEVPVLYQSRNLRWSQEQVAHARELMLRLMNYQDKTREIKTEGQELLIDWNKLVASSIPSDLLRADSPSLPENQDDATKTMRPIDTTTSEAIQLETSP